jgi:putative nucleotidyltransferase with HDIG domain
VGALTQELAKKRGISADEAFVCGLLHDFGKMIAVACIEDILQRAPAQPRPIEYWTDVVERYHVELGLVLAARWRLPQVVADVISLHHQDDLAGAAEQRMVELVQVGDEVMRLLTDRTWLTPEDLGAVAGLKAPECELVSRVVDRLPGFIASFENGSAPTAGPQVIEPAAAEQFKSGPTPVDFPVTVTVSREARAYRATGIAASNLMIAGAAPLAENVLMELKLASDPPLTCWATAKLSWQEGQQHLVLVQPFALNGQAQDAWKGLVRKAVPAA